MDRIEAESDWRQCMDSNWSKLVTDINTDFFLNGYLQERETVPRLVLERIWETKDKTKRLNELLKAIREGDDKRFKSFCEALIDDGQERIVDEYLTKCNRTLYTERVGVSVNDPLEIPLPEDLKDAISRNFVKIIDNMSCNDSVLKELESVGVFVAYQTQEFMQVEERTKRNEMVLNSLLRCSVRKYELFLAILNEHNQLHVFSDIPSATAAAQAMNQSKDLNTSRRDLALGELPVTSHFSTRTPLEPSAEFCDKVRQEIAEKVAYDIHYDPSNSTLTRGYALLISNTTFIHDGTSDQNGTEVDLKSLQKLFADRLNLSLLVHRDLTAQEIMDTCKSLSERLEEEAYKSLTKSTSNDSGETSLGGRIKSAVLVVCILSRGKEGFVLGTDGKEVSVEQLTTAFDCNNCKALVGKPKLFFIQTCQESIADGSTTKDAGAVAMDSEQLRGYTDMTDEANDRLKWLTMIDKADMAVILATFPGFVARRNSNYESYFVQSLAEVFYESIHREDLHSVITKVTARTNALELSGEYKQICQMRTTLSKKAYMLPYKRASIKFNEAIERREDPLQNKDVVRVQQQTIEQIPPQTSPILLHDPGWRLTDKLTVVVVIVVAVAIYYLNPRPVPVPVPAQRCSELRKHFVLDKEGIFYYLEREAWTQRPPNTSDLAYRELPVRNVFYTHTAETDTTTVTDDGCIRCRNIQNMHMDRNKFADIAFNYIIDGAGTIYYGRPPHVVPSAVKGYNFNMISVAFMGNYQFDKPTRSSIAAFNGILKNASETGLLTKNYKVYAMCEARETESPGKFMYEYINDCICSNKAAGPKLGVKFANICNHLAYMDDSYCRFNTAAEDDDGTSICR